MLWSLIGSADVFIEGYRPGVMMECTLLDADAEQLTDVLASYRLYACLDGEVATDRMMAPSRWPAAYGLTA